MTPVFLGGICLLLIMLLGLQWHIFRKKAGVKRWFKCLKLNMHQSEYNNLFAATDGFELSRQSRLLQDAFEYTYGEIEFISFIALIGLVQPNQNTVFYDLGSGVGKAVFACAMVFDVRKSCGIELFQNLHNSALEQQHQLLKHPHYVENAKKIILIHANFLDVNFYDGTIVFINATALFGDTWKALNIKLSQLKSGAIVITSSKKLCSSAFIVIRVTSVCMSWGAVKAYIHQRVTDTIYT